MSAAYRRLAALQTHFSSFQPPYPRSTAAAASAAATAEACVEPSEELKLLTAKQLKDFLVDGVLMLRVDELPPEWHRSFYHRAQALGSRQRHWAQMPEITQICRAPTVRGALTSILGRDYMMHPHRALHTSSTNDQAFHKDGNHVPVRDHYPRWVMAMYYPHDTTLAMGPTCVVPGSQYYEVDRLDWGGLFAGTEMPRTDAHGEQQRWRKRVAAAQRTLRGSDAEARTALLHSSGRFFRTTSSTGAASAHRACTCRGGSIAL
jgi:hypothetical protein